MRRKAFPLILIVLFISVFTGCDVYLNYLSQFGINANVEDRLKVAGTVWGLASSDGYLYAVARDDDGPVVYKIVEETLTLEASYPLSGGQIEDQFSDDKYDDENSEWKTGGRFQGYTDSSGIFYLMDTSYGGRIWLNDNDTTARYLPAADSYSFSFTFYFSTVGSDYVLTYDQFQDLTVFDIKGSSVVTTLTLSGSYHLEGAVYKSDTNQILLLFVPYSTDVETTSAITCQAVTLDALAIGGWDSAYPYGGTAVSLTLGDTEYTWTAYGDDGAGTNYLYPGTQSFYGNDELFQLCISDVDDRKVWLFDSDGTFTDVLYIGGDHRPVLASSGRKMFGAYEHIILKYGVD